MIETIALIGLFFLIVFVIGTFIIYLTTNSALHSTIISLIVYVIVFYVYLIFAEFFKSISKQVFTVPEGDIWDTIYWLIVMIFLLLIIATIVRSIKSESIERSLLFSSIGTLYVLLIYSVLYFLAKNYETIENIFYWLNIIILPFTFLIWIFGVLKLWFIEYLYFVYSLLSLVYVIVLFICIYKFFDYLYNTYI